MYLLPEKSKKQRWKGGKGGGKGNSAVPSPALLTSNIKNAWTTEELLQTYSRYESHLNAIHLSAVWNKLGHLTRPDQPVDEKALASLSQATIRVAGTPDIQARQLANIAHGAAKSGCSSPDLMNALATSIESRLVDCNGQELANTAWAFGKTGLFSAELFKSLAKVASPKFPEFNAQELANTAWACASSGHSDADVFGALARAVEQKLADFNPQGFANTIWAFAKTGNLDEPLLKAMVVTAQQRVDDFNSQDLANTAWAFAKLGQFNADLFSALAKSAEWHLDYFNAQGLANTVWAFAKASHLDSKLFAVFAKAIQRRVVDFNSQDLANTAWAFAKACYLDKSLFTALARSIERCLDGFNAQDLVNTAWAFAKIGQFDEDLFAAIAKSVTDQKLDDLSTAHIANIAWAFAKAGQLDTTLFAKLARSAEQRVADFSAQDLSNIAWAFANAGQLDPQLFEALARAAVKFLDEFNEEELDNTEWAFVRAGQQRIVKGLRQRRKRTAGAAAVLANSVVDVSKCGRIIIAGGGIGGSAVAVALQNKGFNVVVLETDKGFDARKQGYGLTIQGYNTTVQSLGINIAQDDAPSTSHYTFSSEGQILGFYGEAFGSKSKCRKETDHSGRFIHIPRQMLRQRILELVQPDTIRWNSKLKSYSSTEKGVSVTLTDGTNIDGALLIGSDGIFSTVRRQMKLPGDRLNYVGLIVVLGITKEPIPLADRRIFETVDGSTRIYAMPFTTTSTMWQLSFPYTEEDAKRLSKDPAGLKEEILTRCASWHQPIPQMLRNTPLDCMACYPVYDRDVLDPAAMRVDSRVTLIGDAAHPMTPFKAQGANQALSDAVLLADCLIEGIQKHGQQKGIDAALPVFEQKMMTRSSRAVIGSREKAKEMHSNLALQPARKVQREAAGDMHRAIDALRCQGVGACHATDPRGLDTVVEEAITNPATPKAQKRKAPEEGLKTKKVRKDAKPSAKAEAALEPVMGLVGGKWLKCFSVKTKKNGSHKVVLKDGTSTMLPAECVKPRSKKQN